MKTCLKKNEVPVKTKRVIYLHKELNDWDILMCVACAVYRFLKFYFFWLVVFIIHFKTAFINRNLWLFIDAFVYSLTFFRLFAYFWQAIIYPSKAHTTQQIIWMCQSTGHTVFNICKRLFPLWRCSFSDVFPIFTLFLFWRCSYFDVVPILTFLLTYFSVDHYLALTCLLPSHWQASASYISGWYD